MRKTIRPLDALFPRIRQGVLGATLLQSAKWWYVSDLARHLGTSPSSLQRELAQLTAAGFLVSRRDGNRVYYKAAAENPLFPELRRLFERTSGMVDVLRKLVFHDCANRVVAAFIFGSVARGDDDNRSDIDVFVVGNVTNFDLASAVKRAEKHLGREISVHAFSAREFAREVQEGNHFIKSVLEAEKLFVMGDSDDLDAAAAGRKRATARSLEARDG